MLNKIGSLWFHGVFSLVWDADINTKIHTDKCVLQKVVSARKER